MRLERSFRVGCGVLGLDEGPAAAILQSLDVRSLSASATLRPPNPIEQLVREGTRYIQMMAVLPVDPEADASFAEFEKTLIRHIPRRVLTRK